MGAGSFTASSFQLKDALNAVVPTNVTYDPVTSIATLTPQNALQYGATYNVTVKGGAGGVTDLAGNPLAADSDWSFSVEASPPPILVVGSTGNPFGAYVGEILRNEGLQRVHDDRRGVRLAGAARAVRRRRSSGTPPLDARRR